MNCYIPFSGFYESIHMDRLDNWIEGDLSDGDLTYTGDDVDYKSTMIKYAEAYVDQFNNWSGLSIKFIELDSPQYYNFETDRILCEISDKEVLRLIKEVDQNVLDEVCLSWFTTRDGFISRYNNDFTNWGSVLTWDANQLHALLTARFPDIEDDVTDNVEVYIYLRK